MALLGLNYIATLGDLLLGLAVVFWLNVAFVVVSVRK